MEGFCRTSKKLLNWSGFWFEGNSVGFLQKFQCFLCFFTFFIIILLPELYFMYQERNNMLKVSSCISEALTNFLTYIKMIIVYRNRDKIRVLFNDMKEAWQESGIFSEKVTDEVEDIKSASVKRAEVLSKGYAYPYLAFATNFMINPLITQLIGSYVKEQSSSIADFTTPIKVSFPFEIKGNVVDFSMVFAVVTIVEVLMLTILVGFDTLTVCLMNYCGDFFKILDHSLRCIHTESPSEGKSAWTVEGTEGVIEKLKELIRRHNQFINFTHRLEEVLNGMMLAQYMSSTFMICIVGFQLTILLKTPYEFSMLMTYCICLYCQLFMFSWFGSYLTTSSNDVSLAAYEWEWFDAPINVKKQIILIILRSHRPVGVTAAKFYYISIESFAKALSSAVSYFTLLQTIFEE